MDDAQLPALGVPVLMRVAQPCAGLRDQPDADLERGAPTDQAIQQPGQRQPINVLHGDEVHAVELANLQDLDQVWVPEGAGEARLVEEHLLEIGASLQLRQDALDHQQLTAQVITSAGQINLRHSADGEALQELVSGKACQTGRCLSTPHRR